MLPTAALVADKYSNSMSTDLAPCGGWTRNAYTSTGSRTHGTGTPPAVILSPANRSMGPVGPWLPGSHFG